MRAIAVILGLAFGLTPGTAAAAFTPPELFVRPQLGGSEHAPAGDWVPLASAPAINYLGGYQIGYRLQASGEPNELQRAAVSFLAVPDGKPTQPHNTPPYCVTHIGPVGAIEPVGAEVQFEGDGTYTVQVSVGPGSGGPSDCLAGPSTTGSFSVDVHVAPQLVGEPLAFRVAPLAGDPFVGVRGDPPPGGFLETGCARDAVIQADGSIAAAHAIDGNFIEDNFATPGAWACVTRGWVEGVDDDFNTTRFGTPWSAPLRFEVRSDFRRARASLRGQRSARPRLTFTAEFPDAAAAGRATLKLTRFVRCAGSRFVSRSAGRYRGTFDARGRLALKIRHPRRTGFYLGRLTFAGTRFYRAGADPSPVLLLIDDRGRLGYASPQGFPSC